MLKNHVIKIYVGPYICGLIIIMSSHTKDFLTSSPVVFLRKVLNGIQCLHPHVTSRWNLRSRSLLALLHTTLKGISVTGGHGAA